VWYYGTYCLHPSGSVPTNGVPYNWPWLGPFVGFRWSTNFGVSWAETPCTPSQPLFGERALHGEPVKIGSPHFVDLGKELEHSPDGKAYLVAHGASDGANRRFAYNSWITGDEIYLLRVTPSVENMNARAAYEYFAGHDGAGTARWTHDFSAIKPIAAWRDHMGCVTMTYNRALKKFLMCVTDGGNTVSRFNTCVLESDQITGPWKLVSHLTHFGEQAYFANIPSKFVSLDGRGLWLCYAGNFSSGWGGIVFKSRPPGSRYGMCLQEVRLLGPADDLEPDVLSSTNNVAPDAVVTTSSTHPDYRNTGLVDGFVEGWPLSPHHEWASHSEKNTAMARLSWNTAQEVDHVWLFDRPNDIDQIIAGMLVFSDGTTMNVGPLPDDAGKGLEISFEPKKVDWLTFIVTQTRQGSQNVGLAEMAVFMTGASSRH
jgi:hypothetical protein